MTEVVCDFCSDYQRHNRSGGNGERRACGLQEYVRQRICPVRRGIRLHIPGFPSWLFHVFLAIAIFYAVYIPVSDVYYCVRAHKERNADLE